MFYSRSSFCFKTEFLALTEYPAAALTIKNKKTFHHKAKFQLGHNFFILFFDHVNLIILERRYLVFHFILRS